MRIIIAGCGKVGRAIIDSMTDDKHDVTAIDNDPEVIEQISNNYDVMAVCGRATSREMLLSARVNKADLFIAVTQSDEVNMLSCFLAKRMGAKHTVARIREADYNEDGLNFLVKELDLSMVLNPERTTAETLFDWLKLPSAVRVDNFAGKKVQLLELNIRKGSSLCDVSVMDLRKKCAIQFVLCAVQRGDEVYVPNGTFVLREGDNVAIMTKRSETHKFLRSVGIVSKQGHDVMILGGSTTAYYLAKLLATNGFYVKIVERDEDRCADLAEMLPAGATLICGDGMNHDLLMEEGIDSTGSFVALTGTDEENILIGFYADSRSVPKVIAKVNHAELGTGQRSLAAQIGRGRVDAVRQSVERHPGQSRRDHVQPDGRARGGVGVQGAVRLQTDGQGTEGSQVEAEYHHRGHHTRQGDHHTFRRGHHHAGGQSDSGGNGREDIRPVRRAEVI